VIVYANRDVRNRAGVLLIPATQGANQMDAYLHLVTAYPTLHWIFLDAAQATTERQAQELRWRVRIIDGMTEADTQVALGLLADSLGEGRAAHAA